MSLYEYDEELHIRSEKEIAKQEGIEEGFEKGKKERNNELILSLFKRGKTIEEIADILELSQEETAAVLSLSS
ncbi:MAG: hypothetical protein IKG15_00830 [Solobacterium sp.]|nr:hypothetical protein [Solobacterium sp.]